MHSFQEINVTQAKELIQQGNVQIVDIRDRHAYEASHIHGARHVDDESLDEFFKSADKSKDLICYCYHGISSQSAAQYFIKQGFQKVYSLAGGYEQWKSLILTN